MIRHKKNHEDEDRKPLVEPVKCSFFQHLELGTEFNGEEKWLVAIEDIEPDAEYLPEASRRTMKNVEGGFAALVSSDVKSSDPSIPAPGTIQPKIFATLPLPLTSDLPVHLHATLLISGDRRSIATHDHDMQSVELKWNRY